MTATKPAPRRTTPRATPRAATGQPAWRSWLRERLRGREGDVWVLLGMLVVGLLTAAALSGVASAMDAPAATPTASSGENPAGQVNARGVAAANERVYSLPSANPGLMNPAVDQQGRVWFGEMGVNKLAMLDPRTGKVSEWTPPHAQYNIMNEVVDSHGNIWFTEEAASYLGRFDPATQTFTTYPVNTSGGQPAGPEALALDAQGDLWFTEVNVGALGRLDPATGALSVFPLPARPGGGHSYPYALTIGADGHVWYGNLSGGTVGWLDPATGSVTQFPTPDPKAQVYAMATGPDGIIWYTQLLSNSFGRIDPATETVTQITVPSTLGAPQTLYTPLMSGGELWLTSTGANALVRYSPDTQQFHFYTLKRSQSVPYGLALAPDGAIWFTADGAPNYIGVVHP